MCRVRPGRAEGAELDSSRRHSVPVEDIEGSPGPATLELGANTVEADYQVVRPGDAEWDRLYGIWREYWPDAAEYEKQTDRNSRSSG